MIEFLLAVSLNLLADDRCREAIEYMGASIYHTTHEEPGDEGPSELVHSLRVEGSDENSGFAKYVVDKDSAGPYIDLKIFYGKKGLSGLGRFFIQEIRRRHPNLRIKMNLTMVNGHRTIAAFRANPKNPDFSDVPALSALNENYELDLLIAKHRDGFPHVLSVDVTLYPKTSGRVWINRKEELSHPDYQRWIDRGAIASVVEALP